MVITREVDFAIRMLRVLADGEKHTIGEMCKTEFIPSKFGPKIIEKLQMAGYVVCERGKYGGCLLNCDLKKVTLYDLVCAMENDTYLSFCLTPEYDCPWKNARPDGCKVHKKLAVLQDQMNDTLRNLSLYSIIFE